MGFVNVQAFGSPPSAVWSVRELKFILPIFFSLLSIISAQQIRVPVFVSGTEGYNSFRIPAIINLPNGTLLAFCEGRVNNAADFGNVDIVMKQSKDKGKTWSALKVLVDKGSAQAGNPAPVVDLTNENFPNGKIFLFYNTGNSSENEVRKGNGLREVWFTTSTDNGETWTQAKNITSSVHRPKKKDTDPAFNFSEDWRSYANTPGHAMQFSRGKFKGRIYVAANHSEGNPKPKFQDYFAHGFFSDDHGLSFHVSENVSFPGSNESTAAELDHNKLMLNSRNQSGDIRSRIISISSTGGQTWDTTYFDSNLPDPVCQGALLNVGNYNGKNVIAFCNPADSLYRDNLTLRISFDEGKHWDKSFMIDSQANNFKSDYTAYSDIVKLSESEIGVLYETKDYSEIVFSVVKWKD